MSNKKGNPGTEFVEISAIVDGNLTKAKVSVEKAVKMFSHLSKSRNRSKLKGQMVGKDFTQGDQPNPELFEQEPKASRIPRGVSIMARANAKTPDERVKLKRAQAAWQAHLDSLDQETKKEKIRKVGRK